MGGFFVFSNLFQGGALKINLWHITAARSMIVDTSLWAHFLNFKILEVGNFLFFFVNLLEGTAVNGVSNKPLYKYYLCLSYRNLLVVLLQNQKAIIRNSANTCIWKNAHHGSYGMLKVKFCPMHISSKSLENMVKRGLQRALSSTFDGRVMEGTVSTLQHHIHLELWIGHCSVRCHAIIRHASSRNISSDTKHVTY